MVHFSRIHKLIETENKRVSSIKVTVLMDDMKGRLNITDIMLQGGSAPTIWTGHPSEVKWSFDG
ncbi:hypothetical protein [Evansella halocellulosilytica]|uniref:hypothetical protein n=1 Tax=Evansella halocellulosilytica TaxID=2011013 RepID=UPI000BB8B51D|nr:hypothetical protein [Evansella halocellulosilytica]